MATGYTFARGSTIAVSLQCLAGDPETVSSVSVEIAPAQGVNDGLTSAVIPSALATVTFVPATSSNYAYWVAVIAAANSYYLPSGNYRLDAELVVNGVRISTAPVPIAIVEPAVAPSMPTGSVVGVPWSNSAAPIASGTLTARWANAMDASQTVFPALNLTIDPNVIDPTEIVMAPQNWPLGSQIDLTSYSKALVQIDSLSGGDAITFTASLAQTGTPYALAAFDEADREFDVITTPGLYTIPGNAWVSIVHTGTASTPVASFRPIAF